MSLPPDLDPSTHCLAADLLDEDALPASQAQAWTIADDGAAEWALRKLAESEATIASVDARAAAWAAQVEEWRLRERRRAELRADFFRSKLVGYALARRLADPNAKTLDLPSGTVSTRPATSLLAFTAERLTAWAAEGSDLVRVKIEPNLAPIRAAFAEKDDKLYDPATGEIVEGATVTPPPAPFTVSVKVRS